MDDLIGLKEVAALLGVSRQRAFQIVQERADFPAPVATLAAGRVWALPAVGEWMAAHPVRPPGRPRKTKGERSDEH